MRACALQRLHRPRLTRARVLDRLRLVEDDQRPLARPQRREARQRAVGGDDQIRAGEVGRRRASASSRDGIAEGWATSIVSDGAKRSISACQLASSEAGATSRCGGSAPLRTALAQRAAAPAPGSSCRAPCRRPGTRPDAATTRTPARPRPSSDRDAACRADRRRGRRQRGRPGRARTRASPRAMRPASTRDQPSAAASAAASPSSRPAPASRRMPSRKRQRAVLAPPLHALPVREYLAQTVAIQLDPLAAQPDQAPGRGHEPAHLGGGQRLVAQRHADREVEQRVHAEQARLLLAHAHRDLGRGGRFARHQSGTRTTRPAASNAGIACRNL